MVSYDLSKLVSMDIQHRPEMTPMFKWMIADYVEKTARKIVKEEIENFKKEFEKKQGRITE